MEKLVVPSYSEFNRFIEPVLWENTHERNVLTIKGFECLFDNFKKIYSAEQKTNTNIVEEIHRRIQYLYLKDEQIERNWKEMYTPYIYEVFGEEIKKFDLENVIPKDYAFLEDTYNLFCNDKLLLKPYEDDYLETKNKFKDKKMVCINGRNAINKHRARNNLMLSIIENLINEGYFVVNTTIMPPNFTSRFSNDSYMEISENFSYNKTLSFFTNSICVISIENGAGISTHLLSESNFIILAHTESSIRNMMEYRRQKGFLTHRVAENDIMNLVKQMVPPTITKFSDRNKIVNI